MWSVHIQGVNMLGVHMGCAHVCMCMGCAHMGSAHMVCTSACAHEVCEHMGVCR